MSKIAKWTSYVPNDASPEDGDDSSLEEDRQDQPIEEVEPDAHLPIELPPEVLESLPDEVRQVVMRAASYSGPLPPSPMFREYEDTFPGAGDRIIGMAESQAAHRQEWERSALRSAQRHVLLGQLLGFVVSLAALSVSTYMALKGLLVMPIVFGGAGVIGLIGNFVNLFLRQRQSNGD